MQEELNEFERLEVWELVPRSDNVMIITLMWIFKVKLDELRGVMKNKASPRGIFLNQSKYALEIIKKYGMETSDPVDTPMIEKSKLDEDPQGKVVDPTRYHGMIGSLMYLTSSRPDLVFAVCMCARSKHIDIRYHFIKEQVENGMVELYFVRTKYQLADIFTKALGRERLEVLINKLGMRNTMAETFDEQQQQQHKLLDDALVPVNEQVKTSISNLRIASEKIQLDVIFEELSTQKFYFSMGDQVIEVNEYLLHNALNITPKDLEHPFTPLALKKEIIRFVNQLRCATPIKIISALRGSKDPVYGMPIPDLMLNDVIKASAEYSEYLAKSKGYAPTKVTGRGKGLLTKDRVEFDVKKVSIPKRKRSQIVTKEISQSKEAIDDEVDIEGTDEEKVVPLVKRIFTRVSIGKETYRETEVVEEGPGEGSGVTPEVPDVQTLKSINEEAGMSLEVPDEPSNESSSSSSDSEIAVEDISSDDDDEVTDKPDEVTKNMNKVTEKDDVVIVKPGVVTENADNVTMADEVQPAEQQVRNKEHGPNIEPASDTQADVQMFPAQPE
ncbi:hypothetical protein Tco_1254871 [Tanacetum coccineum]